MTFRAKLNMAINGWLSAVGHYMDGFDNASINTNDNQCCIIFASTDDLLMHQLLVIANSLIWEDPATSSDLTLSSRLLKKSLHAHKIQCCR